MKALDTFVGRSDILITGGSSGIGLALARSFQSLGGRVHIAARRSDVVRSATEALNAGDRGSLHPVVGHECDVTSAESVGALFTGMEERGATPAIVVNCAGMTVPAYFTDTTDDDFQQTMDANFNGTVRVCARCVPAMIERGEGYIVNVGSLASIVSVFGMTAYCASKFAVRGFTESLRSEMKVHGVSVSLLCPPDTDTPMLTAERKLRPVETEALSGSVSVLSSDVVAAAALKGMRRGARIIVPGTEGKTTALLQQYAPGVVEWVSDRIVMKARQGKT